MGRVGSHGGITEAAYREEVKTCSPYQACFNLYDQQVYVENPFFEAFEFELSRNKTTLLKGMLENELIYDDWYRQYRIDGSRVAASLTMDDAGISLKPVFNGEGFDAFGAPPSKDFLNAGDASLTWADLENTPLASRRHSMKRQSFWKKTICMPSKRLMLPEVFLPSPMQWTFRSHRSCEGHYDITEVPRMVGHPQR